MAKTAMQQLIESLEGNKNAFPDTMQFRGLRSAFSNAILLAKDSIETEKQQIIDAHTEGQALLASLLAKQFPGHFDETLIEVGKARGGDTDEKAIEYFTQTYQSDKGI